MWNPSNDFSFLRFTHLNACYFGLACFLVKYFVTVSQGTTLYSTTQQCIYECIVIRSIDEIASCEISDPIGSEVLGVALARWDASTLFSQSRWTVVARAELTGGNWSRRLRSTKS